MAWKYPERPIKGEYAIDIDPINQNFLDFTEEPQGYLNEHNFRGPGLTLDGSVALITDKARLTLHREIGQANLPKRMGCRLHVGRTEPHVDPGDIVDGLANYNWTRIDATDFYITKPGVEGLNLTRNFVGGMVWFCASFSFHNHPQPPQSASADNSGEKGFGFNLALELDGTIIPESVVGTQDLTQECFANLDQSVVGGGDPSINAKPRGGGGLAGARHAVVLDAVMFVPAGRHSIRVAVQSIGNSAAGFGDNYDCDTWISAAEIFALEMMR